MPINNAELNFFDYIAKNSELNSSKPLEQTTIQDIRKIFSSPLLLNLCGDYADVSRSYKYIKARDGYNIPIRIFNDNLTETLPALIMYPGTGYVVDAFEINAIAFSRIAKASGIKVIVPEYRLAPENSMPIPIYDSYDAARYIITHSTEFNIDPERVFIGGSSSGAHAATVVANLVSKNSAFKIFHQILYNGIYDATMSCRDYDGYTQEDKWCTKESLSFMIANWGVKPNEYINPMISPFYSEDLSGLPNSTIIIGEYDGVRNDSEAYFLKLKQADNKCQKIVLQGQAHTTMFYRKIISDSIDPADIIAQVIKEEGS